jgi:Zn-dependent protease with chaperone function
MYLLRGVVVSLAVFFLVYAALSGVLVCVWRKLGRNLSALGATTLYGIRVLPLMGAGGLLALFTLPSFLYLEPYFTDERIGVGAFAMAAAGAMVLLTGFFNSARAWVRTSRFLSVCLSRSRRLEPANGTCTYEVQDEDPLILVAGAWRPTLLVSTGAVALLDAGEIHAAIQHELAHVQRRDNLKKLVLRFCALPWLAALDREWLKATEEAADDAATQDEATALDLASALIKMAQAPSRGGTPELGMALVPPNRASVSARVQRLLSERCPAHCNNRLLWWVLLTSAVLAASAHYAWALVQMHEATEFLVR